MDKKSKIQQVQRRIAQKGNYSIEVFNKPENQFIKSTDQFFEVLTFGTNAIILADESIYDWCVENLTSVEAKRIMDGEQLYKIECKLREHGKKLLGQCVRYLYLDENISINKPEGFTYKLYDIKNIEEIHQYKGFYNALNYKDDTIAIAAFDGDKLAALAGADDRLDDLWQIGIDTVTEYRNKGLGAYLVKAIADEIVKQGKLPFYTTWSANIGSTAIALKTGFFPVWVGYYAADDKSF